MIDVKFLFCIFTYWQINKYLILTANIQKLFGIRCIFSLFLCLLPMFKV